VTRIAVLTAMMGALLLVFGLSDRGALETPVPAEAAETTTDFFYGNNGDGTIGPVDPGLASEVLLAVSFQPWCTNCYITRIVPDLVYWNDPNPLLTNGMSANYNADNGQGIWLHHDNVVSGCLGPPPRTIFLSGNERTVYQAPPGYGSYVGVPFSADDPEGCNINWYVGWHIHNNGNVAHKVKVKFTVTMVTGVTLTRLKGVGLNVSTAVDAEYGIGTGLSDTHTCPSNCGTDINTDHIVTAAEQGQIIAGGGHVHDYGFGVSAFNVTRNQWICTSTAGYGSGSRYLPTGGPGTPGHPAAANSQTLNHSYHLPSSPDNAYHIQNMALCSISASGSILCTGDVLRVHASYNTPAAVGDAMGIMSFALAATPPDADLDGTWDGCDAGDSDVDTFSDRLEFMVGTLANDACGPNAWPVDITNNNFVDTGDLGALTNDFGDAVPGAAPFRHDIAPDPPIAPPNAFIDTGDIGRLTNKFGAGCTP
jgi:hypothetical protein